MALECTGPPSLGGSIGCILHGYDYCNAPYGGTGECANYSNTTSSTTSGRLNNRIDNQRNSNTTSSTTSGRVKNRIDNQRNTRGKQNRMKPMYSNQSGRTNDHYEGSCCEWCDDYAQGRAIGNIPPLGNIDGVPCSDEMCGNPQFCPGTRPLTPGGGGRPQVYSNFVDADACADGDYLNHPGLFGWCWKGKKKCEQERYNNSVSRFNKDYPLSSYMSCDELDDTITKIDNRITSTQNSGAKDRVISRDVRALENRRLDFKTAYEDAECSQQRLAEQEAEFDLKVQEMFNQANQRSMARQTEDNTLKSVAIGVGALVIGAVVVMGMRK